MDVLIPFRSLPNDVVRNGKIHVLDRDLMKLSPAERYAFLVIMSLLMLISIIGNSATIYSNIIRKRRPIYQACLLSLAVSDLLTTIFSGAGYLGRLSKEMTLLWDLGEVMCSLVPFTSVCAILASSVTLTAIALDRYQAIVRALKDNWEPGGCFSAASFIIVWSLAAGVSSPMWTSSRYLEICVILTDPENATSGVDLIPGAFCSSDFDMKRSNMIFFTIVFSVIFLPLLVVFLWLYIVVAKEVWIRRKPVTAIKKAAESSADTETSTVSRRNQSDPVREPIQGRITSIENNLYNAHRKKREKDLRMERKVRTFKVILVLMAVFFLCRLPTWIYVLVKHNIVSDNDFPLQNHFNALNLLNSALYPFLYTFLEGTLSFTSSCRRFCKRLCLGCGGADPDTDIVEVESAPPVANRNGSIMVPRGPFAEDVRKKDNFYQANASQASGKPIMTSGVYLGNGIIDGEPIGNSNI